MDIPTLKKHINDLVNGENISDKGKKSLASSIKKGYNIYIKDLRSNGYNISRDNLQELVSPLIKNYDKVKNIPTINEFMQIIANDYKTLDVSEKNLNEIDNIYKVILGNPGSSVDGMSSEYISKIISMKLADQSEINREDILNILIMQSENMYIDIDEYQKLINNSIIAYLTNSSDGQEFANPKVFAIFESLASSYKVSEDFNKVKETYLQALKIKSLKDTPEYQDLEKHYSEFLDYLEMKRNFEDRRFDSFAELMKSLTATFTADDIFVQGKGNRSFNSNNRSSTQSDYIMPTKLRLEGFKRVLNSLKREDDSIDCIEYELGKDKYDGYVILKIKGTNISFFENFNEINARIFVVQNAMIDKIKNLTRTDAIHIEGCEGTNHIENFENYCNNLKRKALQMIDQTKRKSTKNDKNLKFNTNKNIKQQSSTSIIQGKQQSSADNNKNSSDNLESIKENKTLNIDNEKIDIVEKEREKARKNREYYMQLEQEIEKIRKETEEKISEIKRNSDKKVKEITED